MSTPLKLHNAMWPGLVGKGKIDNGEEPFIPLERMLELTANAEVDGVRFDGVDLFLYAPHINPYGMESNIRHLADFIAEYGLKVGTLVAPVWPGTVGDSAMGDDAQQAKFLEAVRISCQFARILNEHGVREYGAIRIDSAEFGIETWRTNPAMHTARIIDTFKMATDIAEGEGERLVAEMEVCWAGMHTVDAMLRLLEGVGKPDWFGLQADLAHVHTAMLGFNSPRSALLKTNYSDEHFLKEYQEVTLQLRPWMYDFHVAQSDGTVYGSGSHDKTGKHCLPDDPNGQLDIELYSTFWLDGYEDRGIEHICWDGCMFPNAVLEDPQTWNNVLRTMIDVQQAVAVNLSVV